MPLPHEHVLQFNKRLINQVHIEPAQILAMSLSLILATVVSMSVFLPLTVALFVMLPLVGPRKTSGAVLLSLNSQQHMASDFRAGAFNKLSLFSTVSGFILFS